MHASPVPYLFLLNLSIQSLNNYSSTLMRHFCMSVYSKVSINIYHEGRAYRLA